MIEVHTASCRVFEYKDKTSYDFNFDYCPNDYYDKYSLLQYRMRKIFLILEKRVLFGIYLNMNYVRQDNSISYQDSNVIYMNIFSKEGYLVNVYRIEILETKFIGYTDIDTRFLHMI